MNNLLITLIAIFAASTAYAQTSAQEFSNTCGLSTPCGAELAGIATGPLTPSSVVSSGAVTATTSLGASYEVVAGAGTTVADAAALSATKIVHQITGANGTVGWKFVTATPIGSVQILLNTTAGVAKIYAESGGTVNGGSADAAFSALTGIKPIICYKTAALTYICS